MESVRLGEVNNMDNQEIQTPLPVSSLPESTEKAAEDKIEEEDDDDRITCTSNSSLNKILKIVVDNVTDLVESNDLGNNNNKAQFLARFTEVFKNIIQENVTVNKLPWVPDTEDTTVKQNEQLVETTDAMFSNLSKALEDTTKKRKFTPKACSKLYKAKLKNELQNWKKAKIEHNIAMPSLSSLPSASAHLELPSPQEFEEVFEEFDLLQKQLQGQVNQIHQVKENIAFAKDIARRQEQFSNALFDTGYHSE